MIPVLVCIPAEGFVIDKHHGVPLPVENKLSPRPIGYLRGFETTEIDDHEMIEKELPALGLTLRYYVISLMDHGYASCLISFAVEVQTYEEACKLPGFVPFGHWTGAFYVPPTIPTELTADFWPNSLSTVKRIALSDCDGNKDLPLYKEDGSFYVSLVPRGQLASMVFLKEDPEYVYTVMHTANEIEAVAAARECFAELK